MDDADKRIGANLAQLRGDNSQAALAAAMRERGWKWSQPTVAAIEKGERAIKLAEAEALVDILGIDNLEELTIRPLVSIWWARTGAYTNAWGRLVNATVDMLRARADLAEVSDAMIATGVEIPDDEDLNHFIPTSIDYVIRHAKVHDSRRYDGKYGALLMGSDYAGFVRRTEAGWTSDDELDALLSEEESSGGTSTDSAE